jgi:hypothetical protein
MSRLRHLKYEDFELKIERDPMAMRRACCDRRRRGVNDVHAPTVQDRLELLVVRLSHSRRSTRRIVTEETDAARELGGKLFEAIFTGEVRARAAEQP